MIGYFLDRLSIVLKCRCCYHRYLGHNIIGVDFKVDNKNELWKGPGNGLGDWAVINRESKGKPLPEQGNSGLESM